MGSAGTKNAFHMIDCKRLLHSPPSSHPKLVKLVDSRDLHRIARKCAGTGCCSVSGQKNVHRKASTSRSNHTRPPRSSFPLATSLTMNARRFQRAESSDPSVFHEIFELGVARINMAASHL